MKHKAHTPILLCLLLISCLSAMGQQTLQQPLPVDIHRVIVRGHNVLNITKGTTNMVQVQASHSDPTEHIINISTAGQQNTLTIHAEHATVTLIVQHTPTSITVEEHAVANISCAMDEDRVSFILRNHSVLNSSGPLHCHNLQLELYDHSVANIRYLQAYDVTVACHDHTCANFTKADVQHSCQATAGPHATLTGLATSRTTLTDSAVSDTAASTPTLMTPSRKSHNRFALLIGFHNWGTAPFNALGGTSVPNIYSIKTSFWNTQIEDGLCFPLSSAWQVSVGVGLAFNKYKFRNSYVSITEDGTNLTDSPSGLFQNNALDPSTPWSSYWRMSYLTLPIMLHLTPPTSRISIAAGVVPGLNIGNKLVSGFHTHTDTYQNNTDTKDHINPWQCDLRLLLTYRHWGVYLQAATLPVNKDMSQKLYPVRFGFVFTL